MSFLYKESFAEGLSWVGPLIYARLWGRVPFSCFYTKMERGKLSWVAWLTLTRRMVCGRGRLCGRGKVELDEIKIRPPNTRILNEKIQWKSEILSRQREGTKRET